MDPGKIIQTLLDILTHVEEGIQLVRVDGGFYDGNWHEIEPFQSVIGFISQNVIGILMTGAKSLRFDLIPLEAVTMVWLYDV